ncbi:putative secreted effector protein [Blumeria graminis f. sp. tritici 96224]|uniref:Putative secreted effector protein n=2 Tax=Blumeria graminis f. sp. tritici 96224 TaxID=1268274 RepID=A0A656KQ72_BLUGR|nr:putative secreted effector protein [Blumeria graminis f. sp. tritici 96224]
MKILSTVSANAFTVLLLLGAVVQGYVLKCATGKEFDNGLIEEYASKAQFSLHRIGYPIGPDGEICKAYEFDIPLADSQSSSYSAYTMTDHTHLARDTDYYLVQVCGGMEGHRLYESYNYKWTQCK